MRLLFIFLFIFLTYSSADEIQRIEGIVDEISKLRSDYAKLEDELVLSQYQLKDEREKNSILQEDLKLYSNYTKKEAEYKSEISSLDLEIKQAKKALKIKEKEIKNLKSLKTKKSKSTIKEKKCLNYQSIKEESTFPKLLMKEQYQTSNTNKSNYFKAHAFRANTFAPIYDSVAGKVVDTWEPMTSFTSNEKKDGWIKITGYFVEKIWRPASQELWIKSQDATMRSH